VLEFGFRKHGHPDFDDMDDYVNWEINRLSHTEFMAEMLFLLAIMISL